MLGELDYVTPTTERNMLKRTPLKRKTALGASKSAKPRKALRKKSKEPISRLQRKVWALCREIALIKYPHNCYTCPAKNLEGSNRQLGHMWAKASLGAYLKYDMRVLRWQCFSCNLHKGGMGADFWVNMVRENGQEYMDKLKAERQITVRAYEHYQSLIPLYEQELKNLLK